VGLAITLQTASDSRLASRHTSRSSNEFTAMALTEAATPVPLVDPATRDLRFTPDGVEQRACRGRRGNLGVRGTTHAEVQGTTHAEVQGRTHAEVQGTRHAESRGARHAESRGARHAEVRGTRHAEVRSTRHAEVRSTKHAEVRSTKHEALSLTVRIALITPS
jgi:hypothetical protein